MAGIAFAVLALFMICAATGCGRKAKPEPLRSAARHSVIQNR